jgi:hypothetical protein
MTSSLEYHVSVRHSIPASIALFALLSLPPILVSTTQAQVNGTPASVTSPGFGGRPINGTPPSVSSPGSNQRVGVYALDPPHPSDHNPDGHHHQEQYTLPPVVYPIAVPYAVDFGATDGDNSPEAGSSDRSAPDSSTEDRDPDDINTDVRDRDANDRENSRILADSRDSESPQEPTLLIFKDGHQLELSNYAILGATLFDLTPGHARKIALADLDLEATQKLNDDRGVTFQIPPPMAN